MAINRNMEEYINDHLIVYENKKATKAETEAALKRLDAREKKISETFFQDKLKNIQQELPKKKLSKQEEYEIYFNKKSPKYYKNQKGDFLTLQEKAKKLKLKALQAKAKIPVIPPKPDMPNGHSDWTTDDWLETIDQGGWVDDRRRAGILEYELADEYWQEQYQNYLNGGGTLSYQQFMQLQLTKKVSKKINEIAEEKKQVEGLATLVGAPEEIRKLFNDTNNRKIPKKI